MKNVAVALALTLATATTAAADVGTELRGSPASMHRQHGIAAANEYTFLRTAKQVERFVEAGHLVPIESNPDLEVLKDVSFPYARPELKVFIERLASQHVEACGERLVVTSLTRPTSGQPRNSHPLSVHPTGMAVDLRVLDDAGCRRWLESTLLSLEGRGLLDVTREARPPHYHIALFTTAYAQYVAPLLARDSAIAAAQAERLALDAAAREATMARLAAASSAMVPATASTAASNPDARWLLAGLPLVALAFGLRLLRSRRAARVVKRR
jgi:hypothetical protein